MVLVQALETLAHGNCRQAVYSMTQWFIIAAAGCLQCDPVVNYLLALLDFHRSKPNASRLAFATLSLQCFVFGSSSEMNKSRLLQCYSTSQSQRPSSWIDLHHRVRGHHHELTTLDQVCRSKCTTLYFYMILISQFVWDPPLNKDGTSMSVSTCYNNTTSMWLCPPFL